MTQTQITADTTTWEALVPMLAHVAVNGDTEQGRRTAMHELLKLARIVDNHIAELRRLEASLIHEAEPEAAECVARELKGVTALKSTQATLTCAQEQRGMICRREYPGDSACTSFGGKQVCLRPPITRDDGEPVCAECGAPGAVHMRGCPSA